MLLLFMWLQFLVACTARLELGSYARILYDWEGQEIRDLKEGKLLILCFFNDILLRNVPVT